MSLTPSLALFRSHCVLRSAAKLPLSRSLTNNPKKPRSVPGWAKNPRSSDPAAADKKTVSPPVKAAKFLIFAGSWSVAATVCLAYFDPEFREFASDRNESVEKLLNFWLGQPKSQSEDVKVEKAVN